MVPRIPSWTKGVAVAVLPVPPRPFVDKGCCSRRSPRPSASLRGQKVSLRAVAVAVLRVRVPSWTKGVAVAVLRGPPWPFVDKRCCSCSSPCPSVVPFVDKRCCSCSSPCPSVALRGQKVLQCLQFSVSLRGSSWTKGVAVLQFSVSLRGSSWTKGVAVAVLRVPPWPFVDKRCCSCSSPWSSVALRGQKVLQLQFSVSLRGPSWTKGVAVAVLRAVPPLRGQKVLQLQFSESLRGSKNRSSCPIVYISG